MLRVISANDVGIAVNPLGLQGQVEGGVMMGLGNATTEEFLMDNGHVVSDRLARYRVPGIMLTPEITSIIVEHPVEAVHLVPRWKARSSAAKSCAVVLASAG